jgi:hypothetical protein
LEVGENLSASGTAPGKQRHIEQVRGAAAGCAGSMHGVRMMLRAGPEQLTRTLAASPVPEAHGRFQEFMQWGTDNTRTSIVVGLIQRLELWTQPRIAGPNA